MRSAPFLSVDDSPCPSAFVRMSRFFSRLGRLMAACFREDDPKDQTVPILECVGLAFQFECAEGGPVESYEAAMYRDLGAQPVTLRLYTDADNAPGALLDTSLPNLTILSAVPRVYPFASGTTPTLVAGRRYWLLAISGARSNVGWNLAPHGTAHANQTFTTDDGQTFGGVFQGTPGAYRVNLMVPPIAARENNGAARSSDAFTVGGARAGLAAAT